MTLTDTKDGIRMESKMFPFATGVLFLGQLKGLKSFREKCNCCGLGQQYQGHL